jgi:putative heme-binding domain-containing protein
MDGERGSMAARMRTPEVRHAVAWFLGAMLCWALLSACASALSAEEAQWIWAPDHAKDQVPQVSAYFRKSIQLKAPTAGQITITADDAYELYVNGRRIGSGELTKNLYEYDITRQLQRGRNTIAVKVTNRNGNTAALAARVLIQQDEKWYSFSTDKTWAVNLTPLPMWNSAVYNDGRWAKAQVFGRLGDTAPWDLEEGVASQERHNSTRFNVSDEFTVERVIDPDETGSLIAMAFNEFGHIIASKEGGPLLLIYDSQKNGQLDTVRVYCDKVKNAQGILALNGKVFVTAEGPEGAGLYRLHDTDRDGSLDEVKLLLKFKGAMGEHGPHGLTLGPDGLLYVIVGNHSGLDGEADAHSPHRNVYEGDLVPRYEDPGGHAVGVKAPGGTILRTDTEGSVVQTFAGGIRNSYDLFFNADGELFFHESDMETDEGTPWFRPTQIYHALPGAEFGWRSGWSWWPEHFIDAVPAIGETGRGSPTGGVVYDHFAFPTRYHGSLFLADWSEGRILNVKMKKRGASYTAQSEVFLSGNPLNVTDVDVGPDGNLYFITGGRGTSGGVYRVTWTGQVPAAISNLGEGISAAIRQPQIHSAWSRQKIAAIKRSLGAQWEPSVLGVAVSGANPPAYRVRAMELMHLFGPAPSSELLIKLSREKSEQVRAKAADLMGIYADVTTQRRLTEMLADGDANVRRKACEALVRADQKPAAEKVLPLLSSDDRALAWSARRLLESLPVDTWREKVLESKDQRILVQGSLALVISEPTVDNGAAVIMAMQSSMEGFVSDENFVNMLRAIEVAISRCGLKAEQLPELKTQLSHEFPAGNVIINRELVRLLCFLQADNCLEDFLTYLQSDVENVEKLNLALHMRFIEKGWTGAQKFELLKFYEAAQKHKAGQAYAQYAANVARDFAKGLSEEEARLVISTGADWPNAALGALYKLPVELDDDLLADIIRMDTAIATRTDDPSVKLKIGIVAVLARSGREDAFTYLRTIYDRDPERRTAAAMGLAQQPEGENWVYLVKSLAILDGPVSAEVMKRLATVDQLPDDPDAYRFAIMRGLALGDKGGEHAIALLEWWSGERPSEDGDDLAKKLSAWQVWYAAKYPDRQPAELPKPPEGNKYTVEELIKHLASDEGKTGSLEKGAAVFAKAQCAKCHRVGDRGERLGPDLTSLSKRFMRKEILESILFPSHVISDQYASKTVLTTDGKTYTGIVGAGAAGETVILQPDGRKIALLSDQIEEMQPSKLSAMPEGLINELSLEEISDLFTYLGVLQPTPIAEKDEKGAKTKKR